jgi:uncharacterized protein (DUF1778 family)
MSAKLVRVAGRKRIGRSKPENKAEPFNMLLDADDRAILAEAARLEKLSRSDIIRRAIRAYYRKLRQTEAIAS